MEMKEKINDRLVINVAETPVFVKMRARSGPPLKQPGFGLLQSGQGIHVPDAADIVERQVIRRAMSLHHLARSLIAAQGPQISAAEGPKAHRMPRFLAILGYHHGVFWKCGRDGQQRWHLDQRQIARQDRKSTRLNSSH